MIHLVDSIVAVILIALAALTGSIASPLILASLLRKDRRRERDHDSKRQIAIAERVDRAADLLQIANKGVADTAAITNGKLDVIHTLVNSNLTASMQSELDATVREVAMMREVIALNEAAGRDPSPEALAAVEFTQDKISELRAALSDRHEQTDKAEHGSDWP